MSNSEKKLLIRRCNEKGFGLLEVVIAVFLTAVGIMAIFSLLSPAWRTVSRSDLLGRASGILYEQLMNQEARIMNPCCKVTAGTLPATTVYASGQSTAQSGDANYTVTTTITELVTNRVWRISVRVAWPGNAGISESLVVSRQEGFLFPSGCTRGVLTCQ